MSGYSGKGWVTGVRGRQAKGGGGGREEKSLRKIINSQKWHR